MAAVGSVLGERTNRRTKLEESHCTGCGSRGGTARPRLATGDGCGRQCARRADRPEVHVEDAELDVDTALLAQKLQRMIKDGTRPYGVQEPIELTRIEKGDLFEAMIGDMIRRIASRHGWTLRARKARTGQDLTLAVDGSRSTLNRQVCFSLLEIFSS